MLVNPDLLVVLLHLLSTAGDSVVSTLTENLVNLVLVALLARFTGDDDADDPPPR